MIQVASAEEMAELGRRIADALGPGDLVVLTGPLGAGKTTLTQGIGAGLGVTGRIVSPTFVIARVHRGGRMPLVHADAYRISSIAEIDDLDLDASLAESVTVVEWGGGLVEGLADDRLEVRIERAAGNAAGDERQVSIVGIGPRWSSVDLSVNGDVPPACTDRQTS